MLHLYIHPPQSAVPFFIGALADWKDTKLTSHKITVLPITPYKHLGLPCEEFVECPCEIGSMARPYNN